MQKLEHEERRNMAGKMTYLFFVSLLIVSLIQCALSESDTNSAAQDSFRNKREAEPYHHYHGYGRGYYGRGYYGHGYYGGGYYGHGYGYGHGYYRPHHYHGYPGYYGYY